MMKYKVIATYCFEVEAEDAEWAQELVDVNCLSARVFSFEDEKKEIRPSYDVKLISNVVDNA